MKRYGIVAISILAVVGVFTGVFATIRRQQAVQVRFNKLDLPKHGVHLITSADPQFESTASAYFNQRITDDSENLKPFSVFIKNSGDKTIVAYMLVWQLVKSDGQIRTNKTAYSEPGILMGNRIPSDPSFKHVHAIEPNGVKGFSWAAPIDAQGTSLGGSGTVQSKRSEDARLNDLAAIRAQLSTDLSEATAVTVSLDGVIFDDGTFVGPDTTGYFARVQAMVNAKLDLLREVAEASEKGKVDEAFKAIEEESLVPDLRITSESSPDDHYRYYKKMFAQEMTGMKNAHGQERLTTYLLNSHKQSRPSLRKATKKEGKAWSDRD